MKKAFQWFYFGMCVSLTLMINASAYLDPSVMTYTIQVVAGVLIAVGAVIGVVWRRTKKKIQDKLGINENARKEVEGDIVEFTNEKKD